MSRGYNSDMNKKKQIKTTRGRGGVGRLRSASRTVTRATRPLQERDVQENERNIFFDELISNNLSQKEPGRSGRCKGRLVELPLPLPPMIMYVPVKVPQRQLEPVMPSPRCPVLSPSGVHHFRAQSMSIVLSPQLIVGNQDQLCSANNINDKWPEDLEQLVAEWDYLPQGHLWEVIKWLSAPMGLTDTAAPLMVINIQDMMKNWDEEYDKKIQDILKWLGYCETHTKRIESPKVVVEMESASVQVCSLWSSMVVSPSH